MIKADPSRKIFLDKQALAVWAIDLTPLYWLLRMTTTKTRKKKAWPDFLFHWPELFPHRYQRQSSNFCEIFLLNAGKNAVGFLLPLYPTVSSAPSPPMRPTYFRYQLSLSVVPSCVHYAYLFATWVSFLRDICLKSFLYQRLWKHSQTNEWGGNFLLRDFLAGGTPTPRYPQDIPDFHNTHQEPKYFPSLLVNQRILDVTHS